MSHRIIKFRVYDKANNKIIYPNLISISRLGAVRTDIDVVFSPDECILQQLTGIKDSKGVEIYEGDIVNVNGGNHIIEWRGAGFACTWSDYNLDTCWFVGGGPVVIGNIFENPELAEKARKSPRV